MSKLLSPEDRFTQAQRTGEMADLLRAFLAGQKDRADIARWTRAAWPDTAQQGGPFQDNGVASAVFDSIWNVEERHVDEYVVRSEDMASYIEWLTRGEAFIVASEPLLIIARPLHALTAATRGQEARMWVDGLGWIVTLRFGSAATGRSFMANAPLEGEGADHASIYAARTDDPVEAALDLIETLAIDEHEVHTWLPQIEHARLPRWSLWRQDENGGRYEVATFLSYARAMRTCDEFERRSHNQTYWVRQQGT